MQYLENLDLWIVDALRHRLHPSHLSVSETLELIAHFKPKRAVLTNLHTDLDYETLRRNLPENVEPAFDFMRLSL
jgi:phosphoribosyl 1,2-cyclic phosphate phosphodiesterase